MVIIENIDITCPYCHSKTDISIDCTAGDQEYIEDCHVCCAPINLNIYIDEETEAVSVTTGRGNG